MIRSDFPQFGKKIPLFAIDNKGKAAQIATVCPQADNGFQVEPEHSADGQSSCLLGESGTGYYEDLPWFLDDLRPQGFLGKKIVQELAESGGYPPDPRYWRSSHLLCFLLEHGFDLPGNLLLGEQAVECFNTLRWKKAVQEQYAEAARDILIGPVYGSSAGGEQPK
ncbi:MAG: hypothetical protein D3910_27425 [Candidatus Electrothrix sp. ATG2]|nr:hypothetical protein [Candidatus Electrothrix sp. ATG2]